MNHSKSFLISASLLSILAISFTDIALAMDDKGKEEASSSNKPQRKYAYGWTNGRNENPAKPFHFGRPQMQEVVKKDIFASLRRLKVPQICKPSVECVSDENQGFKFDGSFLLAEFKRNLPKSDEESLRAKKLLRSLKWQCEISRDRCSNLRRQTELSKLQSLQADEEFALRLNREQAVDPFMGEGVWIEGFQSFPPAALKFVPLEFDRGTPIAHPQDDNETFEMMEFEEKIASYSFNGETFKLEDFPPEAGFVPFEFDSNTVNFQFPQFEENIAPFAPGIFYDETKLASLRDAAQIPPIFDPNNYIEIPSAPDYSDLSLDVMLSNLEMVFIPELPLAQASDNPPSNSKGKTVSRRGYSGRRR